MNIKITDNRKIGWCAACARARPAAELQPVIAVIESLMIAGAFACKDRDGCELRLHRQYHVGGLGPVADCRFCIISRPYPDPDSVLIREIEELLRSDPWRP